MSPSDRWLGGFGVSKEEATNWIVRLAANVYAPCFEAVRVVRDNPKGVDWLVEVGRAARDKCVIVDMQKEDDVKSVRELMEHSGCL